MSQFRNSKNLMDAIRNDLEKSDSPLQHLTEAVLTQLYDEMVSDLAQSAKHQQNHPPTVNQPEIKTHQGSIVISGRADKPTEEIIRATVRKTFSRTLGNKNDFLAMLRKRGIS